MATRLPRSRTVRSTSPELGTYTRSPARKLTWSSVARLPAACSSRRPAPHRERIGELLLAFDPEEDAVARLEVPVREPAADQPRFPILPVSLELGQRLLQVWTRS